MRWRATTRSGSRPCWLPRASWRPRSNSVYAGTRGGADFLRSTSAAFQQALDRVATQAGKMPGSRAKAEPVRRQLRDLLAAAALGPEETRGDLAQGQMLGEPPPLGFGGLGGGVAVPVAPSAPAKTTKAAPPKRDVGAERRAARLQRRARPAERGARQGARGRRPRRPGGDGSAKGGGRGWQAAPRGGNRQVAGAGTPPRCGPAGGGGRSAQVVDPRPVRPGIPGAFPQTARRREPPAS